jgi:hypothetical protein
MSATYSLKEVLPPQVFRGGARGIATYRNFPAFSWPWWWRRALIFGPIALPLGIIGGINVGVQTKDADLALRVISVALPVWLAIMLLGPALATVARHLRLQPRVERFAVVAAVLFGVAVGMTGQLAANKLMRDVVYPRLIEGGFVTKQSLEVGARPWVVNVNRGIQIALFLALGGGPALRTYFGEQRRWREYEHETELQEVRMQRDEADRRLTVLQAQVEPHFLFNTLASVRSLVRSDPVRAEATIDALVDHLRATLPKMRNRTTETSTLGEQVEICRSYLDVMRVRMTDRLSYRVDVPEKLRHASFPPLMLISLVENAIKHGVEPKPGPCTMVVRARQSQTGAHKHLDVDVIDDGAGLRLGMGDGIGLSNIRAQLATRYGDRASLQLVGQEHGGVIATIRLPLEGSES